MTRSTTSATRSSTACSAPTATTGAFPSRSPPSPREPADALPSPSAASSDTSALAARRAGASAAASRPSSTSSCRRAASVRAAGEPCSSFVRPRLCRAAPFHIITLPRSDDCNALPCPSWLSRAVQSEESSSTGVKPEERPCPAGCVSPSGWLGAGACSKTYFEVPEPKQTPQPTPRAEHLVRGDVE